MTIKTNLSLWSNTLRIMLVVALFTTSCGFGRGDDDEIVSPNGEPSQAVTPEQALPQPTAAAGDSESIPAPTVEAPAAEVESGSAPNTGTGASLPLSAATLPELLPFSPPEGSPPAFADTFARASEMRPLLGQLEAELDQTQFDLLALNANLAFDAPALIEHVQTEIAFEQYPGVLRGPQGTLIGRAGNALDQSLLLRQLLDDAGYETRLVRTALSTTQAETLIEQMALARPEPPPLGDAAAIDGLMTQISALSSGQQTAALPTAAEKQAVIQTLTDADATVILDGLAAAGLTFDSRSVLDNLLVEAQDYFWVQYRLSAFDEWQDAHPAFTDPAAAPDDLAPDETFREGPPADLYHRVRLELFVEQKFDEELRVFPLLEDWERTTAELVGQPITLQNQPNNLDLESAAATEELLQRTGVLLPLINGQLTANGFDLDGRVFGADLVTLDTVGMTELFQSAAEGIEGATSLLGDLGEEEQRNPDDLLTLTAQWVEYTIISPDGTETTTRRYLMDRVGEENRAAGLAVITDETPLLKTAQTLLTTLTIMVLPGEYSPAYTSQRAISRTLQELELLAYINPDGSLISFPDEVIADFISPQDILLNGAFGNGFQGNEALRAYRASPTVVVFEQGLVPTAAEPTAFERVDVIHNSRRVFDISGGDVQPNPAAAVRLGVWETFAERVLLQGTGEVPDGALQAIREAAAAGIPLQIIPPDRLDVLQTLPHSRQTIDSAARDLAAGYVVLIPERPLEEGGPTGWWRVNLQTGETLGMGTGGYGQAFVEYLISLKFGALFAVIGYNQCMAAGGTSGCCLYENLALLAIGFTAGYWIGQIAIAAGALGSTSFGIGFLLGDVGLGTAGIFNPVSICS
ncbi:MAG: hypothetical protein QNJ45_26110 [Ardenticatenaceae bacterium]|nr:hypothetical protein [Ardenticatenaceae bacterium]